MATMHMCVPLIFALIVNPVCVCVGACVRVRVRVRVCVCVCLCASVPPLRLCVPVPVRACGWVYLFACLLVSAGRATRPGGKAVGEGRPPAPERPGPCMSVFAGPRLDCFRGHPLVPQLPRLRRNVCCFRCCPCCFNKHKVLGKFHATQNADPHGFKRKVTPEILKWCLLQPNQRLQKQIGDPVYTFSFVASWSFLSGTPPEIYFDE